MAEEVREKGRVEREFLALQAEFQTSSLKLRRGKNSTWVITGQLAFKAWGEDKSEIEDQFRVRISIPEDYSDTLPSVWETGGRIPQEHHRNPDGALCLTTPIALRYFFDDAPNLVGFLKNLLIPYLYQFSYKELYGYMPFGDYSHGGAGLFEHYRDDLNITEVENVLSVVRYLAFENPRGNGPCPCNSNRKIGECHENKLRDMSSKQTPADFHAEYRQIVFWNKQNKMKPGNSKVARAVALYVNSLKKSPRP